MNARSAIVLLAACAALAGCGGGDGGDAAAAPTPAPGGNTIPSSALASVDGLLAYVRGLIAATDDTSEPVGLGDAKLPVDDVNEPASL